MSKIPPVEPETPPSSSTVWSTPTRYFVLTLIVIAFVWLAFLVAPLLQTIGIAILLALLLDPLVRWLMRRTGMSRAWAATIVFFLFLIILFGIPLWMGSIAVTQLSELGTDLSAASIALQEWLFQPVDIFGIHLEPSDFLINFERSLADTFSSLPLGSLNLLSSITTNLLWVFTVFVTLYYFLKDGPRVRPWVLEHVPEPYQEEMAVLLNRVEEIWGKFLRIQLLLFVVFALLLLLGTLLVVWLFRSGLLQWSPIGFALLLLLVYTAVQQIDNLWLRPQFIGRYLQLHPGIVFVGLIAGLAFGGILGALVVIPAIATARVVGHYLYYKILGEPLTASYLFQQEEVVPETAESPPPLANPSPENHPATSLPDNLFWRLTRPPAQVLIKLGTGLAVVFLFMYRLLTRGRNWLQSRYTSPRSTNES
ncbi:MAG: AI-2E family transporter [Chloroflexi bacterium]|nr:MAG: AI-2E family transporter [Chloroflexota bacterium]